MLPAWTHYQTHSLHKDDTAAIKHEMLSVLPAWTGYQQIGSGHRKGASSVHYEPQCYQHGQTIRPLSTRFFHPSPGLSRLLCYQRGLV